MAVLLPNSVFLHNRKTGGMWVREVLGQLEGSRILGRPQAEDLRDAPARVIHMTFDEAKVALRGKQRFYFTFVRNPYSWLESFYAHRFCPEWKETGYTFEKWVLSRPDAWVVHHYEAFTGPVGKGVDFVGRYEDLRLDLRRALRAAGEKFDDGIFDVAPQNVGNRRVLAGCTWTKRMQQRVAKENCAVFERYGYDPEVIPTKK